MALVPYSINFIPSIGSQGTLVEFRRQGDTSWITPNTPDNPTSLSTYPLSLDDTYSWDIRVSSNGNACSAKYKYVYIPAGTTADTLIWVENTYTCEQDTPLTVANTYTGFSSPYIVYPNPNNDMCYVVDGDYSAGNVYKFNPNTMAGTSSITPITGFFTHVYNALVDEQYNRLYLVGKNTGGLKSLDMASDTYTTVSYGADGVSFNRIFLTLTAAHIYGYDISANVFAVIRRSDLALLSTGTAESFPSGGSYLRSSILIEVGSEIWSIAELRSTSTIGVYNSDLSALSTTITVAGVATENGGGNYRQSGFYDSDNGKFYLSDAGSKKLFIIDVATKTVEYTITFSNTFGKNNVICFAFKDTKTRDYFVTASPYNTAGVDNLYNAYKINPITYVLEDFFANNNLARLYYQSGTNILWGATQGISAWNSPSTGYATDGFITKFTR